MSEEPKEDSAGPEDSSFPEEPSGDLPSEETPSLLVFKPVGSRFASIGNKLTHFSQRISGALRWFSIGKVRISIISGVIAGMIVMLGFSLFDIRKDEWLLKRRYPNAMSARERHVHYARDLIIDEQYERAEQILRKLVKEQGDARVHADALFLFGQCLDISDQGPHGSDEARAIYERFIDSYPADPRVPAAHRLIAENLARNERYSESNARYDKLLRMLPDSEEIGEIEFLIARNHCRAGNIVGAVDALERVRQKHSGGTVARDSALLLAWALEELGDRERSERILRQLVSDDSGSPHAAVALYRLAKNALDAGSYESAIRNCTQWFGESPVMRGKFDVMLVLGYSKLAVGAPAGSMAVASDITAFFPDSPRLAEATVLRGRSHEALGNTAEAELAYLEAARVAPDDPMPRRQLARLYRSNGDIPAAVEQMEYVCRAAPRDDAAFIELAKLYRLNAENVNALDVLAEFTRERQLSPYIGEAFLMLSDIQRELDRPQNAYRTLDRLLATGTTTVRESVVLESQADILAEVGLSDDAVEAYRLASEAGADSTTLTHKTAEALLDAGRLQECIAELGSVGFSSLSPSERFGILELRARAYLALGKYEDARRSILSAIALRTGKEKISTLALLLQSNLALQDEAAASKVAQTTLKLVQSEDSAASPEACRIILDWARYLYGKGNYSECAKVYSNVVGPWFPAADVAWAVYQLGNCHYHMADYEKAREAYARLASDFPGSEWIVFARRREELMSVESGV